MPSTVTLGTFFSTTERPPKRFAEPGKMADVVVWSTTPFSVYAFADLVLIDGAVRYDRGHPAVAPESDFMLGQPAAAGVSP